MVTGNPPCGNDVPSPIRGDMVNVGSNGKKRYPKREYAFHSNVLSEIGSSGVDIGSCHIYYMYVGHKCEEVEHPVSF